MDPSQQLILKLIIIIMLKFILGYNNYYGDYYFIPSQETISLLVLVAVSGQQSYFTLLTS